MALCANPWKWPSLVSPIIAACVSCSDLILPSNTALLRSLHNRTGVIVAQMCHSSFIACV
ncbi:hypothetical protein PF003_g2647 [Phytophthora fragariae]|nr:hypothetical protein PF003_g2647 [Phytophthora fragariae]